MPANGNGSKSPKKRRHARRFWIYASLLLCIGFSAYFFSLITLISDHFEGRRWDIPSRIYSDSFTLYPGQSLRATGLLDRLKRLSYLQVHREVQNSGEYSLRQNVLEIYLHDFDYPKGHVASRAVRMTLQDERIHRIYLKEGDREVFTERLEPEVISEFFGKAREERVLVKIDQVPKFLQNAVVAIEDQRFYQHQGVDWRSIARALVTNLRAGSIRQGGSTLTQQLVKNFFLNAKRSYIRKVNEATMALLVEQRYDKAEILECYLNEVYLGQRGSVGIHGVGEAALHYFGKPVSRLDLAESAMLAGIIKGPAIYSPFNHYDRALKRQKLVLEQMKEQELISEPEMRDALRRILPLKRPYVMGSQNSYFVDLVRRQLLTTYPEEQLTWQGLRMFTSIDVNLQHIVSEELQKGLERLEKAHPNLKRTPELQGAVMMLQPQTGYILALSGGRDFATSQFNRAIFAKRQPGSLFKPFVALTAFQNKRKDGTPYTPITEIIDEEISLKDQEDQIWTPQNYDQIFRGPVSIREALEQSINIPMVKLALEVGPQKVVENAYALGIESPMKPVASLALGTSEVTPFELARAFATLANAGVSPELLSLRDVLTQDLVPLERRRMSVREAITPEVAYQTVQLMTGVVDRGTGRGIRGFGINQPLAGKTGTTSDYRDAWFVGFTPDLLCLVWVGFDDNFSLNLSGSSGALPIWAAIMKRALDEKNAQKFIDPSGIEYMPVDRNSHELATSFCPKQDLYDEVFIVGNEPKTHCHLHPEPNSENPGLWQKFKRLF